MATRLLFSCLLFLSLEVTAQWNDNFGDSDFKANPVWTGDTSKFIVNDAFELQLNDTIAGMSYLSVPSSVETKASWKFLVKMGFNPSADNYAKVYLMSDKADLSGSLSGYFLRIGYTNDELCLYRQDGTKETLIANGRDKVFNTATVNASIMVTRSEQGEWNLFCDTLGGLNYSLSATCTDNTILKSEYFGVRCIYSVTRAKKIFFDDFDITGEVFTDGVKPTIDSIEIIDEKHAAISFSEPIDSTAAVLTGNYLINSNTVTKVVYNNTSKTDIELTFLNKFACEQYNELNISNITDLFGLKMRDTTLIFRYCTPQTNDIVFNEIMVKPITVRGLPNAEYIEIYNRTKNTFDITGYKLIIGAYSYTFPEVKFSGESYLLLSSKTNQPVLAQFGTTLGLYTSSSALTNTLGKLQLKNKSGALITQLNYSDAWYNNDFKAQEGGWSLEQIDPWNPCGGIINWSASNANKGGTPGSVNSIASSNPDLTAPEIIHINVISANQIDVYFSEPLDSVVATNKNTYQAFPTIGHPTKAVIVDQFSSTVRLTFGVPLVKDKTYSLKVLKNVTDCVGNTMSQEATLAFAYSSLPDSADIVINEVLFNAKTGGADYIELYNRSAKIINFRNLLVGLKENGLNVGLCRVNDNGGMFYPSSFLLISTDIEKVKPFYSVHDEKSLLTVKDLPTLNDKAATIVLLNDTFGMVDEFSYSDAMHVATLKNTEGIALERVNPSKITSFPGNWHSAAETAGYGTPGYVNSQYVADSIITSEISITDELFSPNNDGSKDILSISYKFTKTDCRVHVRIFDVSGRIVKTLLNNQLLGAEGSFSWDGTNDAGDMCTVGLYIIYVRAVFGDGSVSEYKKSCVLVTTR